MMRMTHKLAFAAACLAICSAVVVKPASAIEDHLSGELVAQSLNSETSIERNSEKPDPSQNNQSNPNADEAWLVPLLWGLGGYLVGSFMGTHKTYTKMNKGERKTPPHSLQ